MEQNGRLSKHFWLAQGMARTIGLNVNEALRTGRMDRGDFSELVATCCHCDRSETCMAWMGKQARLCDSLPGWCALKLPFEALKESA